MSVVSCQLSVVGGSEERGARSEKYARAAFPLSSLAPRRSLLAPPRGISLTEVLIAMGILTLGLLGVAALFPVGGYYMQKAEISDRGSAIAQTVMSDIVTRGMLNPRCWFAMIPNPVTPTAGAWNTRFTSDGKYCPTAPSPPPTKTFTRPLAESLAQALAQIQAATDPTLIGKQFGYAYVLDPMGVAAAASANTSGAYNAAALPVPFSAFQYGVTAANYSAAAWVPFQTTSAASPYTWPIRRLTMQQPTTGWQMNANMAEHRFRGDDDLAVDFPDRDDQPAMQLWKAYDTGSGMVPLKRNWQGDYSWIVSILPKTTAARFGLATSPESFAYEVSVVVFHKRVLPAGHDIAITEAATHERAVKARVMSKGPSGGELLLNAVIDGVPTEGPFEQLKTGQWIMLCGPHPSSTTSDPRFDMHWYQVISIEGKGERLNAYGQTSPAPPTNDPERRLVTVRGPEWPWEAASDITVATELSNCLCVGIFPGAVAVHAKTLRLEGWRGSAWGANPMWGVGSGSGPTNTLLGN